MQNFRLQNRYLAEQGCIPPLCDLLTVQDAKIVQVALNGLENILKVGDHSNQQVNPYAVIIEECYGIYFIFNLFESISLGRILNLVSICRIRQNRISSITQKYRNLSKGFRHNRTLLWIGGRRRQDCALCFELQRPVPIQL